MFGFGKKKEETPHIAPHASSTVVPESREVTLDLSKGVSLNLNKGDLLNLTKTGVSLSKLRLAAGWDMAFGRNVDLDLAAYLQDDTGRVVSEIYFGNKRGHNIYLDGDNLTGEGDGDDENIYMDLNNLLPSVTKVTFAVVIYSNHSFQDVKNAYVRLVDETQGREILKYNLSEDGGSAKAVRFGEVTKANNEWSFKAIGTYHNASIRNFKSIL